MACTSAGPFHFPDTETNELQTRLFKPPPARTRTLDGKKSGSLAATVLEAALDVPRVAELHVVDYHLRGEVVALRVVLGGEVAAGDDDPHGRDTQDHRAVQSPHNEAPAPRDGAVEAGLLAHQHRGVLGSFYDLVAGSKG